MEYESSGSISSIICIIVDIVSIDQLTLLDLTRSMIICIIVYIDSIDQLTLLLSSPDCHVNSVDEFS